jgi:hypothetical protein
LKKKGAPMKTAFTRTPIIITATALLMGLATSDLLAGQNESSYQKHDHHESDGQKETAGSNTDSQTNMLSPDELKKLEKEKKVFFEETVRLRKNIFEKKLALRDALIKNPTDGGKLRILRRDILILKSRLNKKRYAFLKRMSQINPQAGEGYYERGNLGIDPVKN